MTLCLKNQLPLWNPTVNIAGLLWMNGEKMKHAYFFFHFTLLIIMKMSYSFSVCNMSFTANIIKNLNLYVYIHVWIYTYICICIYMYTGLLVIWKSKHEKTCGPFPLFAASFLWATFEFNIPWNKAAHQAIVITSG